MHLVATGKVGNSRSPWFYLYRISWALNNYSNLTSRHVPIISNYNVRVFAGSKFLNRNRHVNVNFRFLRLRRLRRTGKECDGHQSDDSGRKEEQTY